VGDEIAGKPETPRRAAPRAVPVTTMLDIAKLAGVSKSTVSRILNDAPSRVPIAADTRERVLAAASSVGYRPNPLARSLRGAPTMLIGAVVRDFSDPFFASAIEALAVEAIGHGYNIILGHLQGRSDQGVSLAAVLEPRHCDAIIILGDIQDQPRLLEDLRKSPVPIVALWQGRSTIEFPTVDVDDRAGVMASLDYLIALGHERIAFVSAALPGENATREQAFVDFMTVRFGPIPPGYLQRVPNSLAGGELALRRLLELPEPPTAIASSTDLAAVGVLHAVSVLGIRVPHDLSVVGFDDLVQAAYTVPALTTMRMPVTEIVGEGVRQAIELARDPSMAREPRVTMFEPTLIVRDSTASLVSRVG